MSASPVRIELSRYNRRGAVASLANDDLDYLDIVVNAENPDPKAICLAAAHRLRELAKSFERLSTMEKPFTEYAQSEATSEQAG